MDTAKLQQTRELYCFDGFTLDRAERRLWFADEAIPLKPKQFDLLFYFVRNAGRAATKNELLEAIWADTFVEETTLARNVSWLRNTLGKYADGESIIETVPKLGYRFTPRVTVSETDEETIIVEKQTVQYFRGEETITFADEAIDEKTVNKNSSSPNLSSSRRSFSVLTFFSVIICFALVGSGFVFYGNYFKTNQQSNDFDDKPNVAVNNARVNAAQIKIGSVVHLQNQHSAEAGYLDAWGLVKNKPEFAIVPTEIMFVSTHPNPNRDNGSGSWEIVSATGKKDGKGLVYGDKIHLRNMYPEAGHLDNCGWIKDMPVFRKFNKIEKFAVFTAYSEDRDNGTGTWIVSSDFKFDGDAVLEGDGIALENGFPDGGFLNVAGRISDIPAFNDYDGSHLVLIHGSSTNRHPNSGIWIISGSQTVPK